MPLVLDGSGGISGVDGTASNPAIEGTDSNTGIFYPAADTVAIGTGGTEALRVNSSQNVGIGTTSPASKLHVTGLMRICDPAAYLLFRNAADTTSNGVIQFPDSGAATIQQYRNEALYFATNNTERMRIDASGNVGINDTSPSSRGLLSVRLSDGRHFAVGSNAQPVARYDDNGVPTFQFQNYGITAANQGYQIAWSFGDAIANAGTAGVIRVATEQAWTSTASTRDAYMAFSTGLDGTATERARIDSSGNMMWNGTNTTTGNGNVGFVYKFFGGANNIIIPMESSSVDRYGILEYRRTGRAQARTSQIGIGENSLSQGDVQVFSSAANSDLSGGVRLSNGATAWAAISDIRLKTVTGTYTNALQDIAQIEPIKFIWKHDQSNTPQVGVSAQSVEPVVPEAMSISTNIATPDDKTEYLSVRYTELIPLMIASIKELNAKVEAQAAEIAALKGNA